MLTDLYRIKSRAFGGWGQILFTLWLVLLGGNYALYIVVLPLRVLHHLIITLVLVCWLWRNGLPSTRLNWALLASNALVFICALTAIDQRMALENAWFWLNHTVLFFLFVDWVQRRNSDKMLQAHFIAGALLVIGGLLEYAAHPGERVASFLLFISVTGAYAAPLMVLLAGWMLEHRTNRHRRLYLILLTGLGILVLINNSRGAILSLAIGMSALAIWELNSKAHWFRVAYLVGIVAVSLIILVTSFLPGRITGDEHRADLWRAAAYMTEDYPLHGVGPGLYGLSYNTIYSTRSEQYAQGAHNFLLNTAAELGVPGLALAILIGVLFLRQIPKQRTTLQNAALAALVGITVHSLTDNFSDTSFVSLALLLTALLTEVTYVRRSPRRVVNLPEGYNPALDIYPFKKTAMRWRFLLAAGLLSCGLLLLWSDVAQNFYDLSVVGNDLHDAQVAARLDPAMRLYDLQIQRLATGRPALISTDFVMVGYARYWR